MTPMGNPRSGGERDREPSPDEWDRLAGTAAAAFHVRLPEAEIADLIDDSALGHEAQRRELPAAARVLTFASRDGARVELHVTYESAGEASVTGWITAANAPGHAVARTIDGESAPVDVRPDGRFTARVPRAPVSFAFFFTDGRAPLTTDWVGL